MGKSEEMLKSAGLDYIDGWALGYNDFNNLDMQTL
jgi:hypothetical protein